MLAELPTQCCSEAFQNVGTHLIAVTVLLDALGQRCRDSRHGSRLRLGRSSSAMASRYTVAFDGQGLSTPCSNLNSSRSTRRALRQSPSKAFRVVHEQERGAGSDIHLHQQFFGTGRDDIGRTTRRVTGTRDRRDAGRDFLVGVILAYLAPKCIEDPPCILEAVFENGVSHPLAHFAVIHPEFLTVDA